MPPPLAGLHPDIACGYATLLAQVGWRFSDARLVGLNLDFERPHALARPLLDKAGVRAALGMGFVVPMAPLLVFLWREEARARSSWSGSVSV